MVYRAAAHHRQTYPRELLETVANPARGVLKLDYGDTTVVLE